ncbi:MAG: nucleotidyltransferase family protein [bacterium]
MGAHGRPAPAPTPGSRWVLNNAQFAELASTLLAQGAAVRFRAHGRSMLPFVRHGDVLTVEPLGGEAPRVGDVVLHRVPGGRLLAHRVVGRSRADGQAALVTRGDAALAPGHRVSPGQVLGRVVARQRAGTTVRLDRGPRRALGAAWARLWPLGPLALLAARKAGHALRRLRPRTATPPPPQELPVEDPAGHALLSMCRAVAHGVRWHVPRAFSPEQWHALARLARHHGLTPCLYRATAEAPGPPDDLRARLRNHYLVQTARNLRCVEQLRQLGRAVDDEHIPLAVVKGAASLLELYDDTGLRTMVDVDAMVPAGDVARLHETLQRLGYRRHGSSGYPEVDAFRMRRGHDLAYHRDGSLPLDVHACLLDRRDPRGLAPAEMWARTRPLPAVPGLRALDPAHCVLHTAAHAIKHVAYHSPGLPWLLDLALAVRRWRDQIDWPELWATARRWDIGPDVAAAMATIERTWDVAVPGLPAGAVALEPQVLFRGVPGADERRAAAIPRAYLKSLCAVRELHGLRPRLHYLRSLVLPRADVLRERARAPEHAAALPLYIRHVATRAGRFLRGLLVRIRRTWRPSEATGIRQQAAWTPLGLPHPPSQGRARE